VRFKPSDETETNLPLQSTKYTVGDSHKDDGGCGERGEIPLLPFIPVDGFFIYFLPACQSPAKCPTFSSVTNKMSHIDGDIQLSNAENFIRNAK